MLRIPLALLESNAKMGLSNRLLAPFARRVYLATEEGKSRATRANAVRTFGMPIRSGFSPLPYRPNAKPRLLVLGGSQGAAALNERMPLAAARIHVSNFEILHQAGRDRDADVRKAYAREKFEHVKVVPVSRRHRVGDRSSRPDHRARRSRIYSRNYGNRSRIDLGSVPVRGGRSPGENADALAKRGGCIAIRQEAADDVRLALDIDRMFADEKSRIKMADAARLCGRPRAAQDVAEDLAALGGVVTRPPERSNGSSQFHAEAS